MTSGARSIPVRAVGRNIWTDTFTEYGNCNLPANVYPTNGVDPISSLRTIGDVWSGEDRADYRSVIKSGRPATNPYTKSWTSVQFAAGHGSHYREDKEPACGMLRTTRIRTESWMYEVVPAIPSSVPGFSSLAQQMAAQQFIRRARSRISEAQALVSVGELRESVRMVLNARRAVFNKLRAFQRSAVKNTRGLKNVKGRKKAVANAWLEYSFGWAPLVGDTINLANAAAATVAGSLRNRRVNAKAEFESVVEEGSGISWHLGSGGTDCSSRLVATQGCRYFGALRWETGQSGNFTSQFGLTMDNWIPSIWELIPWSFAIDYFTGIGDFLSSITFPRGLLLYYGRSRKSLVTREYYDWKHTKQDEVTSTAIRRYWATPGIARATRGTFERDIPQLIVRVPSLRIPGYKEAYFNLGSLAALRHNNRI